MEPEVFVNIVYYIGIALIVVLGLFLLYRRGFGRHLRGMLIHSSMRFLFFGVLLIIYSIFAIFNGIDSLKLMVGGIISLILGVTMIILFLKFRRYEDKKFKEKLTNSKM